VAGTAGVERAKQTMIVSRIDITFNDGSVLGAEENTRGSSKELLRPPPHVKRWQAGRVVRSQHCSEPLYQIGNDHRTLDGADDGVS